MNEAPFPAPPPPAIYLNVESRGLDLDIALNDIPVLRHRGGGMYSCMESANIWLKPEGNRVRLFGRWPEEVPYTPGQASARVELFLSAPGAEFPTSARSLALVQFPRPATAETYPVFLEQISTQGGFPELKLWTEPERLKEINVVDREKILAELDGLRDAIISGNIESAVARHALKIDDLAVAGGKARGVVETSLRRQFEWLAQRPGLTAMPVKPADIMLRLVGDGQLVQATTASGEAPVAFTQPASDRIIGFEPILGRIKGEWHILR